MRGVATGHESNVMYLGITIRDTKPHLTTEVHLHSYFITEQLS